MRRKNRYLSSGAASLVTGFWGIYAHLNTAKDLPADARWLARVLADPPIYAPWLLFLVCIALLAWVLWHRDDADRSSGGPSTSGHNSPIVSGNGNVIAAGGGAKAMIGNDYTGARGNFNQGTIHGDQNFYDRIPPRSIPPMRLPAYP